MFRAGFVATIPIWLGAMPFGALYAVSARAAGLDAWQTLAMSLLVFAGASQFTAAGLFAAAASPITIILTTLVVNIRHLLLSASIAPHLRQASTPLRALLGFQLTDESYAVGMRRFANHAGDPAYQLGANMSLYLAWQSSTLAGIFLGALITDPVALGLDLVFPLTFIALLPPLVRGRARQGAALVSALLTIGVALVLPGSWYLLIATLGACAVGVLLERRGAR